MRMICLLRVVTFAYVTSTFSFALAIASFLFYGSFEVVLPAKFVSGFLTRPAYPVPRALNEQHSVCRYHYCGFHVFYLEVLDEYIG